MAQKESTTIRKRKLVFCVLLIVFLVIMAASLKLARAHAEYERSEPPAGAVIPEPPAEIHVWFTQELFRREGANLLEVFGPSGMQVDKKDTQIDDDDRTHMSVSLPEGLPTGVYTVRWRTLSADDGDDDSGEFTFTVNLEAAQETPVPSPGATPALTATPIPEPVLSPTPPAPTAPPSGQSGLPCLGGAILAGLGLALVLPPRWRSRGVP
jgi:methionine-rich copper-binding protein CopC